MAMVRSSLGLLSRRLTGSSAALRRGPEILQAPPLRPTHPAPAAPWRPRPAVASTRTFTSPAAARRAPAGSLTFQGQQHFPIISQGTERMKLAEQKMFLSVKRKEKGVCKFYNGKSGSFAKLQDAVVLSPPLKDLPKPETPSPRKRKGLLPFSFKWGKPQNKEVFPEDHVVDSPTNCRRLTISPAATSSSSGSNSGSDDEHYRSQKSSSRRPHRRSSNAMDVFASPPAPRPPQLFSAHMRSQSMLDLQDVTDSTASYPQGQAPEELGKPESWLLSGQAHEALAKAESWLSQGQAHEDLVKPEPWRQSNHWCPF